jgi:hypothetical protein
MNRWNIRVMLALFMFLAVQGCGKNDVAAASAHDQGTEASAQRAAEKMVDKAADKAGATFAKEISKKACEVLTPSMVAETFDVPEGELKQMKIMGCIYSWNRKGDDDPLILEAKLMLLRAHDTVDEARLWFKNATADKTGKELQEDVKKVTEKAKENEDVDTDLKKETVGTIGSLMAEGMKDGARYESISGIGDEAKVAERDGAVWARVGNLAFTVNAYKGPPQPRLHLDPKDMTNVKEITAKSMQAQKEWLAKTHEERKKASIQLARLVIGALP